MIRLLALATIACAAPGDAARKARASPPDTVVNAPISESETQEESFLLGLRAVIHKGSAPALNQSFQELAENSSFDLLHDTNVRATSTYSVLWGLIPQGWFAGSMWSPVDGGLESAGGWPVASSGIVCFLVTLGFAWALKSKPPPVHSPLASASAEIQPSVQSVSSTASETAETSTDWHPSHFRIWCLTLLNFAYGYVIAVQGIVVAPLDAKRLYPEASSIALGILVLCGALAQLVGPLSGHWSDIWRSPLGRRRPLIIISVSALLSVSCLLWYSSQQKLAIPYFAGFFIQQVFANILSSVAFGLVPDLVPIEHQSFAGGAGAANLLAGAVVAFLNVQVVSTLDYHVHYAFIMVVYLLTGFITCAAGPESSSTARPSESEVSSAHMWDMYTLDIRKFPDFGLLLAAKVMYCAVTVVKGFLLFFTQDTFRLPTKAQEEALTAKVAVSAEVSAALAAVAIMLLLDDNSSAVASDADQAAGSRLRSLRQGVKGSIALALGGLWMGLLWFGPVFVGWRVDKEFPGGGVDAANAWAVFMISGTAIWGVGQGIYFASDQALMLSLVPSADEAGRYLALQSVCAFLGSGLGGIVASGLLTTLGSEPLEKQSYGVQGYMAIFTAASVFCVIISYLAFQLLLSRKRILAELTSPQAQACEEDD